MFRIRDSQVSARLHIYAYIYIHIYTHVLYTHVSIYVSFKSAPSQERNLRVFHAFQKNLEPLVKKTEFFLEPPGMVMVSFPATKCTGVLPHIGSCTPQKCLQKGSCHMSKISGSMAVIRMCHRCDNFLRVAC